MPQHDAPLASFDAAAAFPVGGKGGFGALVDWFIPHTAHGYDVVRRMRMLVVGTAFLVPILLLAAWSIYGLTESDTKWQAWLLAAVAGAVGAGPFVLRYTRSHVLPSIVLVLVLCGIDFTLALTDLGLADPVLLWGAFVPLIAGFLVGTWLSVLSAAVLLVQFGILYALELTGYTFPHITTGDAPMHYTMLALVTGTIFVAALAWLYEGHTVARLRKLNSRLGAYQAALEESESRYRGLFEHIPVGVYRSTQDGRVLMANPALVTMLGFETWDDFVAHNMEDGIYAGAGREAFRAEIEATGEVRHREATMRARDGQLLHVLENARAAFQDDGTVAYYEGTVENVTDKRRAERAVQEHEARFRALVQHSSDTISILDGAGVLTYQSPAFERVLGYPPHACAGRPYLDLVHPEDRRRVEVLFQRGLSRAGEFGTIEFRVLHADGHYVFVEAVGTNLLGDPAVRGVVLNSRDVTERKRAEAALVRAKEQAEEVAQMKSTFLANMSHEIRTPLTGILGFAGVLAEEVPPDQREFVELIEKSGRRLLDTLNSVLDLAKLEADQMPLELERLPVGEHVGEAARLLEPLAQERGLTLETDIRDAGAVAEVDLGALCRVVNNLVGNALKFTREGAVTVRVTADARYVTMAVQDTGIGMDAAFLPHLFSEFRQETTGLTRQHEGTGLGLAITRRLVEMMRGHIAVESEKGAGTTFTVTFPRVDGAPTAALPAAPAAAGAYVQCRPRVLAVDDNPSAQLLLDRLLRSDFDADTAGSAAEALRLAEATPYDVVLLDIHLSEDLTGLDVMHRLRQLPQYAEAPIIAFTAFALPGDRERFLNAGFSGYLSKPFTKAQLQEALKAHLAPAEAPAQALDATFEDATFEDDGLEDSGVAFIDFSSGDGSPGSEDGTFFGVNWVEE